MRRETEHPFSPALIAVGGGLAVGAGIAAVPLHSTASSDRERRDGRHDRPRAAFYTARTWAYVTLGGAIGLAAVTAGLAAWYFLGTSTREVVVTPAGIAGRF